MTRSLLFLLLAATPGFAQDIPKAEKRPVDATKFGIPFLDDYRWMEKTDAPETLSWIEAENLATDAHYDLIRKTVSGAATILDYTKRAAYVMPSQKGRYFYTYYRVAENRPTALYVIRNLKSEPEKLVDPFKVTGDEKAAIRGYFPSKNDKYLAYLINPGGGDRSVVRLASLQGGKDPDDIVENVKFSGLAWNGDDGFFYKRNGNVQRFEKDSTFRLMYHRLSTEESADEVVLDASADESSIERFSVNSKRLIILEKSKDETKQTVYIADLTQSPFKLEKFIDEDESNFHYHTFRKGALWFSSDKYEWGDVRKWSVPDKSETVVIPQLYMHLLVDVDFFKDYILCKYKKEGRFYMGVYDDKGQFIRKFDLPDGLDYHVSYLDYDTDEVYVSLFSNVIPAHNYRWNLKTGSSDVYFSPYNKPKPTIFPFDYFETKLLTFKSRDGEDVPITIIHKKGLKMDADNPTILEAYGGFGNVYEPSYNTGLVYFLEKGGVYAYAEVRGNGDKGQSWHEKGKGANKINGFNDFIDAAEFLIAANYTAPAKLAIMGGSQGGLLVGVAMTQRPELFKVAVPRVGVYDMSRFADFSVGRYHVDEYGDVAKEADFRKMMAYSPYQNIEADVNYPITLIITGENDERVPPFQSYKFAAKLQNRPAQKNAVYLRVNRNAGHYGTKATRADRIEEKAALYDFILYHLQ